MRLAARDVFGSKAEKGNRNDDGGDKEGRKWMKKEPKEGKCWELSTRHANGFI